MVHSRPLTLHLVNSAGHHVFVLTSGAPLAPSPTSANVATMHFGGGVLQAGQVRAFGFGLASLGIPQGIVKNSAFVA